MPFEVPATGKWTLGAENQDIIYTSSSQMYIGGFQRLHVVAPTSGTSFYSYVSASLKAEKKIEATVAGTISSDSSVDVLRWSPAYQEYQTGILTHTFAAGESKWTSRVDFPRAFSEPPQVVTCIQFFHLESNKPWRFTTKATDIDTKGFTIHINAWGDTVLKAGNVGWFAHPADRKGVVSGDVSLMDTFRSGGKVYWPSGAFSRRPRICFVGLRYLNSDSNSTGLDFGIDYKIEDDYVKFTVEDKARLEGASFSYVLIE